MLYSLPYKLAIDVSWEDYVEKTDKCNIHGWWEWENGVVRVIELSSLFHESGVDAVVRQIHRATENVMRTNYDIIGLGTASKYFAFFFLILNIFPLLTIFG